MEIGSSDDAQSLSVCSSVQSIENNIKDNGLTSHTSFLIHSRDPPQDNEVTSGRTASFRGNPVTGSQPYHEPKPARWRVAGTSKQGKYNVIDDIHSLNNLNFEDIEKETTIELRNLKSNPNTDNDIILNTEAELNSSVTSWFAIFLGMLFWYGSSMSITALNKYLFDNLDFDYPLLVTFIHFSFISLFLKLSFRYCKCFPSLPTVSRKNYWRTIVPISVLSAAEISLSNLAYPLVSISAMTVIKSSLVVVTYILSVCIRLEKFSRKLFAVVIFIFASICLTVPGMEVKGGVGVVFLSLAVLAAGVRWVLVHKQLQFQRCDPLQLMLLTQPLCALSLAGPTCLIDIRELIHSKALVTHWSSIGAAVGLIVIAIILAFFVVLAEYHLVRLTSSVSLTVAGVGKEVATILMSMILFKESVGFKTLMGIIASIIGIIAYSHLRFHLRPVEIPFIPVTENDNIQEDEELSARTIFISTPEGTRSTLTTSEVLQTYEASNKKPEETFLHQSVHSWEIEAAA